MKRIISSIAIVVFALAAFSCKNSPSTNVMGEYEGNYRRDTVIIGSAHASVTEINPLTVNIIVDLQHDPDFHMYNVEVNSDTSFYELVYNGNEGVMDGFVIGNKMLWTFRSPTDTIIFDGEKVN